MRTMPEREAEAIYGDFALSNKVFFWDWKTMERANSDSGLGGDFLKKLDDILKPHGLEVVQISFDGDAFPWSLKRRDT